MEKQGRSERVLVAVGGNAIEEPRGGNRSQRSPLEIAMDQVADLLVERHEVILTHGNGPQVGYLLAQSEAAPATILMVPLDVCVAYTQASIGLAMTVALEKALARRGTRRPIATLVTRVAVSERDLAWAAPSKPIGPVLDADRNEELIERGAKTARLTPGRWRRVVPSPEPLEVVDEPSISALIDAGVVPIVAGGGGVAGVIDESGWRGVEAVLDKDLTAARLGSLLSADRLVIATDVPHVMVGYGSPDARSLHKICASELRDLASRGHFASGSMGPKVEAAIRFVESGGRKAIITSVERIYEGASEIAGTIVEKGEYAA
jgi:carbamate kinase